MSWQCGSWLPSQQVIREKPQSLFWPSVRHGMPFLLPYSTGRTNLIHYSSGLHGVMYTRRQGPLWAPLKPGNQREPKRSPGWCSRSRWWNIWGSAHKLEPQRTSRSALDWGPWSLQLHREKPDDSWVCRGQGLWEPSPARVQRPHSRQHWREMEKGHTLGVVLSAPD